MALVRLKKVMFDEEHNYLTVIDNNYSPFMLKLFSQTVCSCKISEKSKCVHILAVMKANGMPITLSVYLTVSLRRLLIQIFVSSI